MSLFDVHGHLKESLDSIPLKRVREGFKSKRRQLFFTKFEYMPLEAMSFQQDNATRCTAHETLTILQLSFPRPDTSHSRDQDWSSLSCNLTRNFSVVLFEV